MKTTVILMGMFLTGCLGLKISGESEHVVKSEGPIEVVLKIDISGCAELKEDDAKLQCITGTIEAFRELNKTVETIVCYKLPTEEIQECVEGNDNDELLSKLVDTGVL